MRVHQATGFNKNYIYLNMHQETMPNGLVRQNANISSSVLVKWNFLFSLGIWRQTVRRRYSRTFFRTLD